jgi:hypothetical protein
MDFVYFGGLAFLGGLTAGLAFGRTPRRALLVAAAGGLVAASLFAYEWLQAPHSQEDAGYVLSDGGQWLGRYWEGWLVAFFAGLNWLSWAIGVGIAIALRGGFERRPKPQEHAP